MQKMNNATQKIEYLNAKTIFAYQISIWVFTFDIFYFIIDVLWSRLQATFVC